MTNINRDRLIAIEIYLDIDVDEIAESSYDETVFETTEGDFMVLTEKEANDRAKESIIETLWAFRPSFLAPYTVLSHDVDAAVEILQTLQEKCEDSNESVRALVKDNLERVVKDAISADGRGHFLAHYDGEENEQTIKNGTTFYIYQIN